MDLKNNLNKEFFNNNSIKLIKDKDFSKLYLLKYIKSDDDDVNRFNNPAIRQARGIILENETNKIICYGLDKFNKKPDTFNISECQIEEAIDGTQIRLYYYNNEWNVTTARCISAKKSKWNYVKTFYNLFEDVKHFIDYEKLNKKCTYTFIMRHIENRIINNVKRNELIHIHTRDNETLLEIDSDIGVEKPKQYVFENYEDFLKDLDQFDFETKGYVVQCKSDRYMYHTKNYEEVKELKGNNLNSAYQYLELLNNNNLDKYLEYFPESELKFNNVIRDIDEYCKEIHRLYLSKHVRKEQIQIPNTYKDLLYKLHGKYLNERTIITLEVVKNYFYELPIGRIVFLLKNKQ